MNSGARKLRAAFFRYLRQVTDASPRDRTALTTVVFLGKAASADNVARDTRAVKLDEVLVRDVFKNAHDDERAALLKELGPGLSPNTFEELFVELASVIERSSARHAALVGEAASFYLHQNPGSFAPPRKFVLGLLGRRSLDCRIAGLRLVTRTNDIAPGESVLLLAEVAKTARHVQEIHSVCSRIADLIELHGIDAVRAANSEQAEVLSRTLRELIESGTAEVEDDVYRCLDWLAPGKAR